jgi:4-amino-4-deoxy-L-arabinose transferase-like glycosyltransferase
VRSLRKSPSILFGVRELTSKHRWFFITLALAGIALRLVFVYRYPHYAGDSLLYTDIAQNWLHHGTYALTENGVPVPTLIRLPGYPAFLAAIFALGGNFDSLRPVLLLQTFIDLAGCLVIASLALELFDESAARCAFALAALCPFTANYVALPLTETLAIFFAGLALLLAAKAVGKIDGGGSALALWFGCGVSLAAGVVLRPDGGILLAVLLFYLVWRLFTAPNKTQVLAAGLIVCVVGLAPLAPWTLRNWRTFHVFQPLAPRYANAPDEFVPLGFNRWVKTWLVEYVSVEDVFWNVSTETPGEVVNTSLLPARAFDSPQEKQRTEELFAEFNQTLMLTPQTDAAFADLARERIAHHPVRYYLVLPAARVADMWLRPRTEMLPVDQRWWTFDDPPESCFSVVYGTLNLLLVVAGFVGLARFRHVRIYGVMLAFLVVRSVFLSTMENPEPRYVLECFPVILVMAGAVPSRLLRPVTHAKLSAEML